MHNLKLVEKTDLVLRTPAQPVLENELDLIKEYSREMKEIMLQYKGIGLAAPQVGIAKLSLSVDRKIMYKQQSRLGEMLDIIN